MFYVDKSLNTTVWIGGQFSENSSGIAIDPTSATADIWTMNTPTPKVTLTLTKFDSKTGYWGSSLTVSAYTAGTYQVRINFVLGSDSYCISDILVVVDDVISNTYLDQYVSKAGQGNGSNEYIDHTNNALGVAVEGVQVYITSDLAGSTVITANQYSLSDGSVTWYLPSGTYYEWMFKPGQSWANPKIITIP